MGKCIPLSIFFAFMLLIGDIGYNKAEAANGMKERKILFHRVKEDNLNYYFYYKPANKKTLDKYTIAKKDYANIRFKSLSTSLGIAKIEAVMNGRNKVLNKNTSRLLIALPKGQENSIKTFNLRKSNNAKKATNNQPKVKYNTQKKVAVKERKPTVNKTNYNIKTNSVSSGQASYSVLDLHAKKVFEDELNLYLYGITSHNIKEPYVLSKNSFRIVRKQESETNEFKVSLNGEIDRGYNIIGYDNQVTVYIPLKYDFRIPHSQ